MKIKNVTKSIFLGAVSAILLTGCGSTLTGYGIKIPGEKSVLETSTCKAIKTMEDSTCSLSMDIIKVSASSNRSSYGMTHKKYNNATYATLQAAAHASQYNEGDYFAIVSPEMVSNTRGVLSNTAEEFMDKCEVGAQNSFYNIDPCGMHSDRGGSGHLVIQAFGKPQENLITYNAEDVLMYLKKNKLFDVGVEEHYQTLNIGEMSAKAIKMFKY